MHGMRTLFCLNKLLGEIKLEIVQAAGGIWQVHPLAFQCKFLNFLLSDITSMVLLVVEAIIVKTLMGSLFFLLNAY